MAHSWLAYLPPHLAADLLAHPDVSPLDRVLRQQAVALFADISGFTPMSEALANAGSHGTEELSSILNQTFGTMIGIIHSYGGSIGKFAGDALTVVFPYQARTKRPTVRRAIQCALDMQAAMTWVDEHLTSAGVFHITMKIGLGMGSLLTTTVGDPATRLEYLLAGSAIDRGAEAERYAPTGAVVVGDDLLAFADVHDPQPRVTGFHALTRLRRRPRLSPAPLYDAPDPTTLAWVARYLPPSIVQRLETSQPGFVDEHRTVTTLFVRFVGFDYQDAHVIPHLQAYLADVVQISDRYGGYLRQVDVGDKGSLYIVLFGAPIAHEDDAERAVLCALDLRAMARQRGIGTTTGITTGRIFCGMVGAAQRQEYAAIGDSVNLAARLMSAAQQDQILVDTLTRQRVTMGLEWHTLPPLTLKGKTTPVLVAALDGKRRRSASRLQAPSYRLPMVGRQTELATCLAHIAQVRQGRGQIVAITSEAGMGKSRLIAEVLRSEPTKQLRYLTSECLSYGTHSSYLLWQPLLRALFGLTPTMPLASQHDHVQQVLHAIDPQLVERMPLLSAPLNLPLPDTDLTRRLDAKLRKASLEQLLVVCFRHWANTQPLLLVLEDCHWIDALSADLLFALAQWLSDIPLLLLLTYRPVEAEQTDRSADLQRVRRLPHYHEYRLAAFSRAETAELIALKLIQLFGDTDPLPAAMLDRIVERAQGNPFYIDELLNLLHDRGLQVRDAQTLDQIALPESVERLILSRIDRLSEGPKTILKLASIIGRVFKAPWLWQLAPELGSAAAIQEQLGSLQQLDFTQLERSEPELEYLFKHLITREVAYESLAYATRTTLHEQVGALIEQIYAHELERWLDVLAYHYGRSVNVAKQREYFWRAGQAAKANYANRAAIDYFERVLPLMEAEVQGEVLLALAEVQERAGHWQQAAQHARTALEQAERADHLTLHARASCTYGICLRDLGEYTAARAALEGARATCLATGDQHTLILVLNELATVQYYQCQYDESRTTSEAVLELAPSLGDVPNWCAALNNIAVIATDQGQFQTAIPIYERAIALAQEHRVLPMLLLLHGNLGITYLQLRDVGNGFPQLQQQHDLALRIGSLEVLVAVLANMGACYRDFGMLVPSRRCAEAALALLGEQLQPRFVGWLLGNFGRVLNQQGERALAEQILLRAVAVCRTFKIPYFLVMTLQFLAESYIHRQQWAVAQMYTLEGLEVTREFQLRGYQFEAELVYLRIQVACGQVTSVAALTQLEQLQTVWTNLEQQASIHYTAWQIDPWRELPRHRAATAYQTLYATNPLATYRQRYQELTGEDLPAPPPLPDPPPIVYQHTLDLPAFLARVDALLAEAGSSTEH